MAVLTTERQLQGFLRMTRFCHIWIPNFGLIDKPLYEALIGKDNEPLSWTVECHKMLHVIKEKFLIAPALGLLDIKKQFHHFVDERQGISPAVLTQN